jgi:hypothetical protein
LSLPIWSDKKKPIAGAEAVAEYIHLALMLWAFEGDWKSLGGTQWTVYSE